MPVNCEEIEKYVRSLSNDFLIPKQPRICAPRISENIERLRAGEVAPAIKVVNGILCDGHHRYIAGLMFGSMPEIMPWELPTNYILWSWQNIQIDCEMWPFY